MITNFKLFENTEPKFNIGDYVYVKNDKTEKLCKIKEIKDKDPRYKKTFNFYILEEYPYMQVREDQLIPEYEVNVKKYNL
jgi:hypothetical protein